MGSKLIMDSASRTSDDVAISIMYLYLGFRIRWSKVPSEISSDDGDDFNLRKDQNNLRIVPFSDSRPKVIIRLLFQQFTQLVNFMAKLVSAEMNVTTHG